ncbi:MAG: YggS family pyridoxal phosphate-dependent enzyme [Desulfurivibrio sp.]|nr:YggS family pyridoxal phosphate-dependent enzyme [Desulfurivibrio sp.]MBU4033299.1 YggS family pyridoxal phosphate-dependent enzyme [Pseudomonadota bacterium]MBU4118936.1 YggS family pyridoxal phosphate-dependent enzyme [Pseudomonadota bacterium]
MGTVAENIEIIRARIRAALERAGREPGSVRLVAVSKRQPLEAIREAMAAGQVLFGENYLQEAHDKVLAIDQGVAWHCIGHLQSNKARIAAEIFDCIETLDRLKLGKALESRLAELGKTMPVLIQVNVGGEAQKAGVAPHEAAQFCRDLQQFPHLIVQGLMTMPPFVDDPEESRGCFRQLRLLGEELAAQGLLGRQGPVELSMGMSGDFEVAIEEGATLVRVGTALFGER